MDVLEGLDNALDQLRSSFEASLKLKDGECVVTFVNKCPPSMSVFIVGAVISFHYNDNTNSPNVSKKMNVGSNEADTIASPAKDKCVQNVIGIMSVMQNGTLNPNGIPFSANVPSDRCLRSFTTGVQPAKLLTGNALEAFQPY